MKILKKIFAIIFISTLLLISNTAHAKNEISVKHVTGKNITNGKIFNATNIYPGWSESKIIRIKNESETDNANIYFKFETKNHCELEKKLKLYVIRVNDKNYRIGGTGDHWTIKEADGKNLYIDKLEPQEKKYYKIKVKFEEQSGNEYQNLSFKFDLDFKIKSDASNETEEEILASQNRTNFTGTFSENKTEDTVAENNLENQKDSGEILGASILEEGTQKQCQSWPLIKWILALITYLGILNFNNFYKIEKDQKTRWFWQLTFTMLAIVIWTIFDECRYYSWFPTVTLLTGLMSYMLYLGKIGSEFKK